MKTEIKRLHNLIKNSTSKEIINFSSTNFTSLNAPNLDLTQSTWNTPTGTATFSQYTGSLGHTYTITLSNGDIYYANTVANENYTHSIYETEGGSITNKGRFVTPNTFIIENINSNLINLNNNVRIYVDNDEFKIQILEAGFFKDKFRVI